MTLRVEIQGLEAVGRALDFIEAQPMVGMWQKIGATVQSQTLRRFQEEKTDPEGNKWKPWSVRYAGSQHGSKAHKPHPGQLTEAGGHSLLVLEGHLRDSIEWAMEGSRALAVGSDLPYAPKHQKTRPFLGLSDENEQELVSEIVAWLEAEIPKQ